MRVQRCLSPSLFSWRLRVFLSHLKNSHQPCEWAHQTPMRCSLWSRGAPPSRTLPMSPALSSIRGERQKGHPPLIPSSAAGAAGGGAGRGGADGGYQASHPGEPQPPAENGPAFCPQPGPAEVSGGKEPAESLYGDRHRALQSDPPGAFLLFSSFIPSNSSSLPHSSLPHSFSRRLLGASCLPGSVLSPKDQGSMNKVAKAPVSLGSILVQRWTVSQLPTSKYTIPHVPGATEQHGQLGP